MTDQAATLRVLRGGRQSSPELTASTPGKKLAIGGGKGGVGKSTLSVNLAVAYAQAGCKTLVVDGDVGMADLNLLLGIAPEKSILDVLGGTPVEDVVVGAHGISVLPGLNGSHLLATLGPAGYRKIVERVATAAQAYDALVVDLAAGIGEGQTSFSDATEAVVVVNPEPLSMADAYAALKILTTTRGIKRAFVVPNRVVSRTQADEVVGRLGALVARFLDLTLVPLPAIPSDPAVTEAAQIGVPLLVHSPDSPAARAIRALPRALAAATTQGTP